MTAPAHPPGLPMGAKARPIIFSPEMVRALLRGDKTQTRRLATSPLRLCKVGDRLWVREAYARAWELDDEGRPATEEMTYYRADGEPFDRYEMPDGLMRGGIPWKPSIHMPRWASRLTLTVTEVRVQPLHRIRQIDAVAEGAPVDPNHRHTTADGSGPPMVLYGPCQWMTAVLWFHRLWDELHGDGAFEANPEVVALTFTVARQNIDTTPPTGGTDGQ